MGIATGAKLYINGCPLRSDGTEYANPAPAPALADDSASLFITTGNDCSGMTFGAAFVLYRRSDSDYNQNLYKTSGDVGKLTTQSVCTERGSTDVYTCATGADEVKTVAASGVFTTVANVADTAQNDVVFVNGIGPMKVSAINNDGNGNDVSFTAANTEFTGDWFDAGGDATNTIWTVDETVANTEITAGKVLLMDGRRYKVKTVANDDAGKTNAKITLTETYAGGQLMELCSQCITDVAVAGITLDSASKDDRSKVTLAIGDKLMVSGQTHQQLMVSTRVVETMDQSIEYSKGNYNGLPVGLTTASGLSGANRLDLYKALNTQPFKPILVTESNSAVTYQYVSQCSNRGTCDSSTGLCTCFQGYSNDNCNTQNMLAG